MTRRGGRGEERSEPDDGRGHSSERPCSLGGAWYLRAYVYTGNPVFPFFKSWFGGAGLDEVLAPIKRPLAVDVWNLLGAIVPLTLEPDRFDSFAHQFGPIFLLFLPALLLERRPAACWAWRPWLMCFWCFA